MVTIGQVWTDQDKRRRGRTFKVTNIDSDGTVCVENLTGPTGGEPTVPISFIKKSRFIPRYYRLKSEPKPKKPIKTASTVYSDEKSELDLSGVEVMPIVIKRVSSDDFQNDIWQQCMNHWPANWKKIGSFIMASDESETFEVMVRPDIMNIFQVWIKFNGIKVWDIRHRGTIEEALDKAKLFFNRLIINTSHFVFGKGRN